MKSLKKTHFYSLVTVIIFLITYPAVAEDILLGRPTDDSITVNVVPDQSGELSFEYGTTSGVYGTQTNAIPCTSGAPAEQVISGLAPDTKYYYRMLFRATSGNPWTAGDEHSFHTQRASGSAFTFTVTSDSHVNIMLGNASEWTKTLNNIAADHPDFELDLGDTFAMDGVTTAAGAESAYLFQRPYFGIISHSVPVFLAPGNHEQEEGWHLDDTGNPATSPPVIGTNAMKKCFLNPFPDTFYFGDTNTYSYLDGDHLREDYYAWEWGDALFVVIDPFWYTMTKPFTGNTGGGEPEAGDGDRWHWTLGLEQFNWFKTTLENSTAKYKFVFAHHMVGGSDDYVRGGANPANLVEWGGYNEAGTTYEWNTKRPGWGSEPIHQMMVANGVSAFFHGHDHQYAYEKRDDIVYQSVPAAGFTGNGFGIYTTGSGYTIQALPSDGHLRVTVSPSQATVDYIKSSDASVYYSYNIAAAGPSYNLTMAVAPTGGGTTDPAVGVHNYTENTVVNITATHNSGYVFDHWEGDVADANAASTTVTMDANQPVTAHFAEAPAEAITHIHDIGTNTIKNSSDANLVVTTSAAVVAGDDIIVAYATDPTQDLTITVTDSAGNKYQQAAMAISVGNLRTYTFAAYNVSALPSGSTITIHQAVVSSTVPAARAAVVSVFRGLAPIGALEQTSVASGTGTTPSSGAATTVKADQLLIGVVGTEGPGSDAAGTWGNSFTAGPRAGTTATTTDAEITVSMGWRIVSDASAYTAAKSGITSRDWAASIATFKTTAAGISYIGDIGSAQTKASSGTSLTVTTNAAVAAGDDILVTFAADPAATVSSVTDSASNTYNKVVDITNSGNVRTIILAAYNVNALPGGSTITINHASVTARAAVVSVFRGLANSSVLDQTHTGTGSSNPVSSGATSATTQANELLIGAVGLEGPNYDAPSVWQNSFTYGPRLGTNYGSGSGGGDGDITAQMGWRIVAATGAYTAQITNLNTTRDWAAAIVTFKGGPSTVTVPDVVEMALADANTAIVTASLTVGNITTAYSDTIAAGLVISQNPIGGTVVDVGSAVNMVVSLGQPVVPDVIGQTQVAAMAAITSVDSLTVSATMQYSNTVAAGLVISQNPVGGTAVNIGSNVAIVVSLGQPVVPDVVGQTQAAATAAITSVDSLTVSATTQYSNTIVAGLVISQSPVGGTVVPVGSNVEIVVSLGQPVVPDVVGQTQAAAAAAITSVDNLTVSATTQYSNTVAAGLVISQNPIGGTAVNIGSNVAIVVSLGQPVVPDVVGQTQAAATAAITSVDSLTVSATTQYSNTIVAGLVISQNPVGGTAVNIGSNVAIVVSLGQPVVPNVVLYQLSAAQTTIINAGLTVGVVTNQYSDTVAAGFVISQNPTGGISMPIDSPVDLVASLGHGPRTISGHVCEPDVNIPIAGVLIQSSGDANAVTDPNGCYELEVNYGWSGSVVPSKEGYSFNPNGDTYVNVIEDQNNMNYIGTMIQPTISGRIFENNGVTPLNDVNVSAENGGGPWTSRYGGGTWLTDANGYYKVVVDYNWSGKVTPTKYAYGFTPANIDYDNVIADQNNQNYNGKLLTFIISGYIKNGCSVPMAGILVDANNGGGHGTTDVNGFYEVWVDYNWSGTVTPGKAHYTFDPNSKAYAYVLNDVIDQNYTATNIYDLDCDGSIGFGDLGIISENWLNGPDLPGDFYEDEDDIINFLDFADFANVWGD